LILDTNAVSALLTGDEAISRRLDTVDRHHLPLPAIAEYRYGLLGLRNPTRLQALFRRLEAESITLCPDRETAETYAAIRHELKQSGQPIPSNDLWIAALARQHSIEIVSHDPHFDAVEGIQRIGW
jgi:tRNA(fMet)-specific endonuclease VapC